MNLDGILTWSNDIVSKSVIFLKNFFGQESYYFQTSICKIFTPIGCYLNDNKRSLKKEGNRIIFIYSEVI